MPIAYVIPTQNDAVLKHDRKKPDLTIFEQKGTAILVFSPNPPPFEIGKTTEIFVKD